MDSSKFTLAAVAHAREAMKDYTRWAYLHPGAGEHERLNAEWHIAKDQELDTEAKVYFSVLVNEFHKLSVSGREDSR